MNDISMMILILGGTYNDSIDIYVPCTYLVFNMAYTYYRDNTI